MRIKVIYAVDIHQKAIKFVSIMIIRMQYFHINIFFFLRLMKHFTSTFEKMIFLLIVLGVACLSLNLFQVSYLQYVIMYANCFKIISNIVQ